MAVTDIENNKNPDKKWKTYKNDRTQKFQN